MQRSLSLRWLGGIALSAFPAMGCAHAQIISSYDSLRSALKPGDHVTVVSSSKPPGNSPPGSAGNASSESASGTVAAVSADSVAITINGTRRDIPRASIERLEKLERQWRRSTLTGLAIGGGTGAAIAAFSECREDQTSCGGTRAAGTAGMALFGAGIGAAVGTKWRPSLVYVGSAQKHDTAAAGSPPAQRSKPQKVRQ